MSRAPAIVAHRGLHDRHPENSLRAFRAAWAAGFQWCECDVHLAADGTPIVLHDETLERTTTGAGRVCDASMDQLQRTTLRDHVGRATRMRVPALWMLLRQMPFEGRLLVEVKAAGAAAAERVVQAIRAEDAEDRCIIQSFAEEHLHAVAAMDPPMPVAWLIDRPEQLEQAYRSPWPRIHAQQNLLDELTIRPLRHESKSVGAWTLNEEIDIRRLLHLGVDTIITDHPRRVREIAGM